MKVSFTVTILATFILAFNAGAETVSGPITLSRASNIFDSKNMFSVETGKIIKVKCGFYVTELFGRKVLWAGADLENTSAKSMHYAYYVAFFDKDDQLVGCTSEVSMRYGIPPGKKMQITSCIIPLNENDMDQITSYKVTFYESSAEIGR